MQIAGSPGAGLLEETRPKRRVPSLLSQVGTLLLRKELRLKLAKPITSVVEVVLPAALCLLLVLGANVSTVEVVPNKTAVDEGAYLSFVPASVAAWCGSTLREDSPRSAPTASRDSAIKTWLVVGAGVMTPPISMIWPWEKTARRWALQLRASASLKSTHAAVLGWRENVDLEFDGVEPCPICYGVLHPKSKRLPHLECRQCHNKFHASCLAHWFSTSHKHLCVVCQTEFVAVKSTKKDPKRDAPPPPPAAPAAPLYDDNELD